MSDEQNDELVKKAKLLADATGRSFDDVLEDLLDDGELNNSNTAKADLVTQLKEAAELITTVQAISQEVSENSVLNGGENKTEVKVETTLEGDIVDRAIESVQRKADNIKKLAATLIPVFLLLTGGSMEAFLVSLMFSVRMIPMMEMIYQRQFVVVWLPMLSITTQEPHKKMVLVNLITVMETERFRHLLVMNLSMPEIGTFISTNIPN